MNSEYNKNVQRYFKNSNGKHLTRYVLSTILRIYIAIQKFDPHKTL